MPAPRVPAVLTLVAALCLGAAACGGGDEPAAAPSSAASEDPGEETASGLAEGLELLEVEGARLGRPSDWEELDVEAADHAASYAQPGPGGTPVGQLDVFVDSVPAGSQADAIDAQTQGERTLSFRELESVRRERVDVPGAESGFLTESTYTTQAGEAARSVELTAIGPEGEYVLVRLSAAADAYDADLAQAVLDSLELVPAEST